MKRFFIISLLFLCNAVMSQDTDSGNTSNQAGDLNTNQQGATVDSNNETNTNTNQYNGAGSASQIPVATSTAPSLMSTGPDSCLKSKSGGMQSTVIGFSKGDYVQDPECNRRKDSVVLYTLNMKIAAITRMCQSIDVWEAMLLSGTPCPIVVNGKVIVGKSAFITLRRHPEIFIPNYKKLKKAKKLYYHTILGIGENNGTKVQSKETNTESDNSKSISDRYRTVDWSDLP